MWTLLLILGFGGVLVLGDEVHEVTEVCELSLRTACPLDVEFPQSRMELNEICPSVIKNLECNQDYHQKCFSDGESDPVLERAINTFRNELCREDSLLNAAIGDNLKCIKSTMDEARDGCNDAVNNLINLFQEHQFPNGLHEIGEPSEELYAHRRKASCLRIYTSISCALHAIAQKCGSIAREASLELMGQIRFFEELCQPGNAEEFLTVVPQLQIDEDLKSNLLEILELK